MIEVLFNGQPFKRISAFDRGLQFGDGLFETIAVINQTPCLLDQHLKRLHAGCIALGIQYPDSDLLRQEISTLAKDFEQGVIKLLLTRGESGRGYGFSPDMIPNRILYLSPWPSWLQPVCYEQGLNIRVCQHRLSDNPQLAGIKHLNRLDQVLARHEWSDPEIAEGLMLDQQGNVIEAVTSNVFIEKAGQLYTPLLEHSGVAGIIRALVMEIAQSMGQPVLQKVITLDDVINADALYLTNCLMGVMPVASLADKRWDVGLNHPVMQQANQQAKYAPLSN